MIGLDDGQQSAITGEVRDISAGGIQIEHVLGESKSSQRARMIEVGAVFPNLSFELYGKTIHCSAQLRWKKETGNKSMLLGLKFIKISRADLEGIRLFVMDESYDYIESILSAESKS